jgi:branched-chain amino acid transport system substrate-binding protein
MSSLKVLLPAVAALSLAAPAFAQDTLKIGIVNGYSGQFADPGAQLDAGIVLWLAQHDNMIAGKKVELIRKDTGGIAPDVAKRLAEELVVRDQVDVLVGGLLTPNAMAVGDVSAEAEKFFVVMNATTPVVTTKSPYMIRASATSNQINYTFGQWVAGKGIKNA